MWLHGVAGGGITSVGPSPSEVKAMLTPSEVVAYWIRGSICRICYRAVHLGRHRDVGTTHAREPIEAKRVAVYGRGSHRGEGGRGGVRVDSGCMVGERESAPAEGRLVAVDVLRGLAIAWVVLFHIWGDLEFFPPVPRDYYEQLTWQFGHDAGPLAIFTAFTDLLFRDGFQGVPLFMMISGVSLTIAAYRAGDAVRWPRFFIQRFRKLLVPYWVGVALTYAVIMAIAWRQVAIGGGTFADHLSGGVTISAGSTVNVDGGVVFASLALIPRLLRDEWFFAPQLALWFVGLLAQYYLLFPALFVLMKRIGVVPFLLLTFGMTVAANAWEINRYMEPELQFRMVTGWAPFRLFEFTAGMAVGWLLASPERHRALAFVRQPAVLGGAIVLGLVAHTTGDLMIGQWGIHYWQAFALPLVTLGLALLALPLLVKRPSRIDASMPVRGLVAIGVMSYTILIVSDAMRLVASEIRIEGASDTVWWTFLIAVYVPVTLLVAWPLARVLGLLPKRDARVRQTRSRAPAPSAVPEMVLGDAVGAGGQ